MARLSAFTLLLAYIFVLCDFNDAGLVSNTSMAVNSSIFANSSGSPTPTNSNGSSTSIISSDSSPLTATALLNGSFGVSGRVSFVTDASSKQVHVDISMSGLMTLNASAQYAYHIHTNPISPSGNCSSALGHLDPLLVTDAFVCDPQMPQYCQLGDLSGRHGKLAATQAKTDVSYTDSYLRFWPQPFSLLGRSVVVHAPNSTRIACGNITSEVDKTADAQGLPAQQPSNYVTEYPLVAPPTPTGKLEPFSGTSTISSVVATITMPAPLPDVSEMPNPYLTLTPVTRTVNNQVITPTLLNAIPAATGFTYTTGSSLPNEQDPSLHTNITASGSTNSKPSNAVENFKISQVLLMSALVLSVSI